MSWYRTNYYQLLILRCFSTFSGFAQADKGDYLVGIGVEGDTAEGRAISLFGNFGLSDSTRLSATGAYTRTAGILGFDAAFVDLALDHSFDSVGFRLGASYWGDAALLDSVDVRASVYFRNERFSISGDYERRDFDFTFQPFFADGERTVSFYANGAGLTSWFETSKNTGFYVGGMDYEYSIDIQLQENIDVLRVLSISRLSLINSLVDYRLNAGFNARFGLRSLDLSVSNWRTEMDQGQVTSYAIGFTTPLDDYSDLELRFAYDDSENFGSTYVFSVFFYTFGS
jgi:hypothetical protein